MNEVVAAVKKETPVSTSTTTEQLKAQSTAPVTPSATSAVENQKNVENHKKAAQHHEAAAKHHHAAAKHHEEGDHKKAAEATVKANGEHCLAAKAAKEDAMHHCSADGAKDVKK